jgi:hypothetical protein
MAKKPKQAEKPKPNKTAVIVMASLIGLLALVAWYMNREAPIPPPDPAEQNAIVDPAVNNPNNIPDPNLAPPPPQPSEENPNPPRPG